MFRRLRSRLWSKQAIFILGFVVLGVGGTAFVLGASTTYGLWDSQARPAVLTVSDTQGAELGLKFRASVSGLVQGVRFYKSAQNTGQHTGTLWDKNGNKLATATFANETGFGWQTVSFKRPVAITANTTYVVSYFAPKGQYSVDQGYFKDKDRGSGKLLALKESVDGPNGVIRKGGSNFPNQAADSNNFWIDVVFVTSRFRPSTGPASATGLRGVGSGTSIALSWQPSLGAQPIQSYNVYRDGNQIAEVRDGATTYTDKNLTADVTYSYQVQTKDTNSATSDPSPATFIKIAPGPPPANLTSDTSPTTQWKPTPGMTWQWQLTTPVDVAIDAQVFDIDLFDNDASVVGALHTKKKKVICHIETGGWKKHRPDASRFPANVLGDSVDDHSEEKYVDVRRLDILGPIMTARLDLCRQRGFDGVEPDLDDSIFQGPTEDNVTGFPITYEDMLNYNKFIATEAHKRGLSIGLKNGVAEDGKFARDMEPHVDWALSEQCAEYDKCDALLPFVQAGKAVFEAEYKDSFTACPEHTKAHAAAQNPAYKSINFILKQPNLDAKRAVCSGLN